MADRDSIAAAATAVVVLALGAGYVVTQGGSDGDDSRLVPDARKVSGPCGAGDLVAGAVDREGAAGTSYLTVSLELARGAEPCTVRGYPSVLVLSDGRPAGVPTVDDSGLGRPERLTVLPDRSAKVTLAWSVDHYCGPVDNDGIRLWVADGLPIDLPGFGPTSCSPGESRPAVRVGGYATVSQRAEGGTVAGVVALNGGPAPGTGEFVTSGEVLLVGADTFRAPVGEDGTFRLVVPAGTYAVAVSTRQWNAGDPYDAGELTVLPRELNDLNVILPIR
ncbi:DUF4232 domain-containing protein [Nocardioides stalactiti]|uniref:DUF4232 domain-containing protein n=1 Tax=Nocardioides stalactiti TaxID=2755356 RepID=UPI0015FFD645|nr:DUF4232 domain-containing protein [Nocardioides stalactiti]